MGAIQVSKLVLQMLSVVIYALGPQKNRFRRRLRFFGLCFILISSCVELCLQFTELYKPGVGSALFPRTPNSYIATPFHELVHAIFIALLGLLEAWRTTSRVVQTGESD